MKNPIHSFIDTDGSTYISCAECKHGGNGEQDCSRGYKEKRVRGKSIKGCFQVKNDDVQAELLDKFDKFNLYKPTGKLCDCGGNYIFTDEDINWKSKSGDFWFKIINYPHIACENGHDVLHVNGNSEILYKEMVSEGELKAESKIHPYVIDFKKYL